MKAAYLKFALLVFIVFGLGLTAQAQEQTPVLVPVVGDVAVDKGPEDVLNRGTPRGSVNGFLEASSVFDFEKAAEFLDLRNLPGDAAEIGGPELARQLNHVLSRAIWLDDYTLSDRPEGIQGDGLPSYRDELVVIKTEEEDVALLMQQVPRGDGENIWKVSNRSVARIPALYDQFSYDPWVEAIRVWFPDDAYFLGFEAFKWAIILAFALLSWPILYLLARVLLLVFSSPKKPTYQVLRKALTGPLVVVGILLIGAMVIGQLGAGAQAQQVMKANTLNTIVFVWVCWSILNLVKTYQQEKLYALDRPGAAKLMQPIIGFIKIVILLFGALFWLANMGVNISTVLAGLGVGGLAMALALQRPIEDMMGALSMFTQAPIKVGDLCQYGTIRGTIEDIGLRSTRVRTLSNTLVHIPNARIANLEIENFTQRTMIRYWPTLRLRYDISPAQIREINTNVLEMLQQEERVHDAPLRVRFTDFDEDAILIKVNAFLKTTDFPESLEIGEELNLRIMEIVNAVGAEFALPGRSIYMQDDK